MLLQFQPLLQGTMTLHLRGEEEDEQLCVATSCCLSDGSVMFYLLHELNSLPLLLLPQPLPPLSLLETFAERVVVVKVHLQEVEAEISQWSVGGGALL